MTSDELYAIDPSYAKWRDEHDIIMSQFYDYAHRGANSVEPEHEDQ
jgi:hypothetical protein